MPAGDGGRLLTDSAGVPSSHLISPDTEQIFLTSTLHTNVRADLNTIWDHRSPYSKALKYLMDKFSVEVERD